MGTINWQDPVMIHDANTGEETSCDTWIVCDDGKDRLVLATNIDTIFAERN